MRFTLSIIAVFSLALAACTAEAPPAESADAPGSDATAESADAPGADATAESAAPAGHDGDSGVVGAEGVAYGEAVGEAPVVELAELCANADAYAGQRVRITGLVTGVCAKRGCWINIGAEEGPDEVTFKVTDGVIVFPMSAQGKWVTAEGTAQKIELNLEKAKQYLAHKAEESGEEFDPATVTEPLTLVRLGGLGAVISDERPGPANE